jgi:hypothetical protein
MSQSCIHQSNKYFLTHACNINLQGSVSKNFVLKEFPSRPAFHNLVNILRSTELLIHKKPKTYVSSAYWVRQYRTQAWTYTYKITNTSSSGDWGVKIKCKKAIQLLQHNPHISTVIHALQLSNPFHFYTWFVQSVSKGEITLATDIPFWWIMVSLIGIHKYTK